MCVRVVRNVLRVCRGRGSASSHPITTTSSNNTADNDIPLIKEAAGEAIDCAVDNAECRATSHAVLRLVCSSCGGLLVEISKHLTRRGKKPLGRRYTVDG